MSTSTASKGWDAFYLEAAQAAVAWKGTTTSLPPEARGAGTYGRGTYEFCLPKQWARHNLLPEAREIALDRFAAADIRWHRGVAQGPCNHLLSSQVQCVNALAPFVNDPEVLASMFSTVLPIAEVLPFGSSQSSSFDRGDHVVFEWGGLKDYLGEHPAMAGLRGSMNTSPDAAFRYRSTTGSTELALIEWKYTERYKGPLSGGEGALLTRKARYKALWDHGDRPVTDSVPYEALFFEPFYQLMRLQLLAWRMEVEHELGVDVVRLVIVAPGRNWALSQSFSHPEQKLDGVSPLTVHSVWKAVQVRPDRFAVLDSATLVGVEGPTSSEFKRRYGHMSGGASGDELQPGSAREAEAEAPELTPDVLHDRLRSALDYSRMVLLRVAGAGGVLEQLQGLDDATLARADSGLVEDVTTRLDELAEQARDLRAEEIAALLDAGEESG